MCKRILTLITIIALILSICSCSVLESIPGIGELIGGQGSTDTPDAPDTPDVPDKPDDGDKPGDNDGGNTDEKPDDPGTDVPHEHVFVDGKCECGELSPVCDCWKDEDGDTICDNCGMGGLIPPDLPPCEDGCKDANGDAICDVCGSGVPVPPEICAPVVFLAGDSTVKTYEDGQFIGGWGQFLSLFLEDEVIVKNAAHGGRSSRSFINEGRLYDIEGSNYSFSQNGGNSIGDEIKAGDYLLIQFGHNDDDTKSSNYATMYDRMVPLGKPDAKGIYPTTPGTRQPTTYLPDDYYDMATDSEIEKALTEIAKYGDEYYAYGDGTYKWYLKQYIDFAREKGAIPILVTPVARVKFNSKGEIIGGAGLHGENFAYVEAVRQLAAEENCLLIDLFAESKTILERATPTYANYLMALKPNELVGTWPSGYDAAYGNVEAGYTGIEATHYNKYGAFLQAAMVAEHLLSDAESFRGLAEFVITTPESYIDPSNLIGRNTVASIEGLFELISVTNPDRWYAKPEEVISKINEIEITFGEITTENYEDVGALCVLVREAYNALNVDDRPLVTNYDKLEAAEARVKEIELANRPAPTKTVIFDADDLALAKYDSTVTEGDFTLIATSDKSMEKKSKQATFTYNGTTYENAYGLSLGGSAKFGQSRCVSFEVDGPCTVTIAVQSSGSAVRTLNLYNSSGAVIDSYEAGVSLTVSSVDIESAGTFTVGSAGSGMYIFAIIIEYFE